MGSPKACASKEEKINCSNSEIRNAIDEWIRSERDRAILKRRLIDGITYEVLAEEFDLSDRTVKSIVYKGMDRLCMHLP